MDRPGRGQRAEERDRRGCRVVPVRRDRDEVHRDRVAGFRALQVERPALRIHERELDHPGDQVLRSAYPPAERVLGPHLEHRAGPDGPDRPDPAERPCELRRVRPVRDDLEIRHRRRIPWRLAANPTGWPERPGRLPAPARWPLRPVRSPEPARSPAFLASLVRWPTPRARWPSLLRPARSAAHPARWPPPRPPRRRTPGRGWPADRACPRPAGRSGRAARARASRRRPEPPG